MLTSKNDANSGRVKVFSGLKTISLVGIIVTHFSMVAYFAPATSIHLSEQGYFYVLFYFFDIWLMISGFFLSYLLLKQFSKLRSVKVLLLKMLRRFTRLWPLYLFSLFVDWKLLPYFGDGPLWPLIIEYP